MDSTRKTLALFAKYWIPGEVKTRLAAGLAAHFELSAEEALQIAADFHRGFVAVTAARSFPNSVARQLWTTHVKEASDDDSRFPGWQVREQSHGNLGVRLERFLEEAIGCNGQTNSNENLAVVVGADSPWLTSSAVEAAFAQLEYFDIVLGPALDGGFYLLGARRYVAGMLRKVPWSQSNTMESTVARFQELGLSMNLMPPGADIDELDDLQSALAGDVVNPFASTKSIATELAELLPTMRLQSSRTLDVFHRLVAQSMSGKP